MDILIYPNQNKTYSMNMVIEFSNAKFICKLYINNAHICIWRDIEMYICKSFTEVKYVKITISSSTYKEACKTELEVLFVSNK